LNYPKAKLRILDAIERMRKVLSANTEASINIECLLEDEDMSYTLTREEFEGLIKDSCHKIQDTLNGLKDMLNKKGIKYSDVEIIGGGSRIPIVQ
jgi:heat shock protein 4